MQKGKGSVNVVTCWNFKGSRTLQGAMFTQANP